MITLTRLSGSVFVLNSDLIERIDSTPDSVVTLIDGKKYVVSESLQEIVDAIRAYRGQVIAIGSHIADAPPAPVPVAPDPVEKHDRPKLATIAKLRGEG